jgi:hypothetical protein
MYKITRTLIIVFFLNFLVMHAIVWWTSKEIQRVQYSKIIIPNELVRWKLYLFKELEYDYSSFKILNAIAQCESGWNQFDKDGKILKNNGNFGIFQINKLAHLKTYRNLGIDIENPYGNIKFAVFLYQRDGISPWYKWSGHCWYSKVSNLLHVSNIRLLREQNN